MRVRLLRKADIPVLAALAESTGFPYIDAGSPLIEALHVVVDDEDHVIAACASVRLVELYLWPGDAKGPVMLHAIRMLHESLSIALRAKGYSEANVFLPPGIALRFGRRLMRTFGWVENWRSWSKKF